MGQRDCRPGCLIQPGISSISVFIMYYNNKKKKTSLSMQKTGRELSSNCPGRHGELDLMAATVMEGQVSTTFAFAQARPQVV